MLFVFSQVAKMVCPSCGSEEVELIWESKPYLMDIAGKIYRCKRCGHVFAKLGVIKFKKGQLG